MKKRGFEIVEEKFRKNKEEIKLPSRGTEYSAGYDFYAPDDIFIPKNSVSDLIFTDIKAYMCNDEFLQIHIRSSIGIKKGIILANTTGIIDSDYYSNKKNDGNIGFKLRNLNNKDIIIKKDEAIIQGIFTKYLLSDNDNVTTVRDGGFGSTT